jgi:hypothetical protein
MVDPIHGPGRRYQRDDRRYGEGLTFLGMDPNELA